MARTIGAVNKVKALVADRCKEMGADPLKVLCDALKDDKTKFEAARELMQYIYPKRKAIEYDITEIPDGDFEKEAQRRANLRILNGDKAG